MSSWKKRSPRPQDGPKGVFGDLPDDLLGDEFSELKEVLAELPRRAPLSVAKAAEGPTRRRAPVRPRATSWRVLARSARWLTAFARCAVRVARDRAKGRKTPRQFGVRLRQVFEEMGATAIKIGQQLSVRIDMFPVEVCDELARLTDRVPPFATSYAIRRIELAAGMRLHELFQVFDPRPIGSASIACVFQGVLRTGEEVAVKVQRPNVGATFAADLGAIDAATRALEFFAFVKPGFFKNLRNELRAMFVEELDFYAEARYQRLFRWLVKKDRLDKKVDAPQVFGQYSSGDVLMTAFVRGVWCNEVLAAAENEDRQALSELKKIGITPRKLGKRLMNFSFWGRYEALFFHSDPHPGNIIVQEGCKVIFIDFGSCGVMSRKSMRAQYMIMDRMSRNDVSGTVEAAIATLEPLPRVDVYELKKELENAFWSWLFAFRDKKAEWWERTTAGLWLALLEVTRQKQIPVGLETLRLARSLLLLDTLCFRLYPKMVSMKEFDKYIEQAGKRAARRARKRVESRSFRTHKDIFVSNVDEFAGRMGFLAWQAERYLDAIPQEFNAVASKGAYVAEVAIRFTVLAGGVLLTGFMIKLLPLREKMSEVPMDMMDDVMMEATTHPAIIIIMIIMLWVGVRRVLFRLQERDKD